ncbi:hypothetical protein FEM03_14155 [Phragmitibacter flavus]|uniref:Uncharacterized protein n=1 Tax=Phragmitibacter flavus TaxID=2576071 RepID=A0A5R8KDD0_9BACT|nr:hypothetical protein [Phragmitibacter flavus]TLD70322.1 hypothetical protein FEM03_14155 [Phragmitibacter flavus]
MIIDDSDADQWLSKVSDLDPINNRNDQKVFVITAVEWADKRFAEITEIEMREYISKRDCYWIANRILKRDKPSVLRPPAMLVCSVIQIVFCALQVHKEKNQESKDE